MRSTNRPPSCTGSGRFAAQPLLPEVTYNFIVTDSGEQIELLNTNAGVVLHGAGRRISKSGKSPRCRADMILGAYGYRLDGSLPVFRMLPLQVSSCRHSITHTMRRGASRVATR